MTSDDRLEKAAEARTLTQYRCDEIGLNVLIPHDHDEAGCPRDVWVPASTLEAAQEEIERLNDLIDHEDSDECVCGPRVEPVERSDGSFGWVIVHHSLDGREHDDLRHYECPECGFWHPVSKGAARSCLTSSKLGP